MTALRKPAPDDLTREQRRSRRKRDVRGRTIAVNRLSKSALEAGRLEYPVDPTQVRPRTRGECAGGARPCPWVSCRYNLYLDVNERTGSIKLNYPELEPHELGESCALDIADTVARNALGGELERVGALVNVTRERVRQIEIELLRIIGQHAKRLREHTADETRKPVRRLTVVR